MTPLSQATHTVILSGLLALMEDICAAELTLKSILVITTPAALWCLLVSFHLVSHVLLCFILILTPTSNGAFWLDQWFQASQNVQASTHSSPSLSSPELACSKLRSARQALNYDVELVEASTAPIEDLQRVAAGDPRPVRDRAARPVRDRAEVRREAKWTGEAESSGRVRRGFHLGRIVEDPRWL